MLAGDPPTLLTPTNGTTINSSRLEWQSPSYPLYTSSPYRIQVDDDPSFVSLNKDYYTNNTYYTPTLSFGTWYWKVKVKDSSSIWSDWSTIWSFILTDSTPSPSPTQTQSQSPSPTPTPPSTPQTTSSFTISNIPSQINSDQSFNVSVNLTLSNNRNTDYYLSGAFKKADGTRYFGLTKISSNWVKYESSNYLNQYKITTDGGGNWTGVLEVKPDTADSDYKGTGDYIFKVSRYTANGSQTWSDESTIEIISTESEQDETLTNTTSPTTGISNSPSSVKTTTTSNKSSKSKNYDTLVYHNASVAGATASAKITTPSAEVEVKNQKQTNPFIWIGLIFIFAGVGLIGYIYLKKNAKIHIPFGK